MLCNNKGRRVLIGRGRLIDVVIPTCGVRRCLRRYFRDVTKVEPRVLHAL